MCLILGWRFEHAESRVPALCNVICTLLKPFSWTKVALSSGTPETAWENKNNVLIQRTSKMCPLLNASSYSRKVCPIDAAEIDAIVHSLIPSPIPSKYMIDKLVGEIPVNILNGKI